MANAHDAHTAHDDHHDEPAKGIKRWLFATNHKDIGTMYLVFSLIMFFIGGAMAMVIRAELFKPGLQIMQSRVLQPVDHECTALIMVFGASHAGVRRLSRTGWCRCRSAHRIWPSPRMNNFSFWLLPVGFAVLLVGSFFAPGGATAARLDACTRRCPRRWARSMDFPILIFAVHLMGASSIMGGINIDRDDPEHARARPER